MTERTRTNTDAGWLLPFIYFVDGPDVDGARVGREHSVIAHVSVLDGRRVIDQVVITAPDITAATLRGVPAGPLAAYAARGEPAPARLGAQLSATIAALRAQERVFLWLPGLMPTSSRAPLTRPDGTDPEGFARRVAAAYNEALASSATPAKRIAAEANVPVTTVHRWIREARRLGLLPPGRKGRAG